MKSKHFNKYILSSECWYPTIYAVTCHLTVSKSVKSINECLIIKFHAILTKWQCPRRGCRTLHQTDKTLNFISLKTVRITLLHLRKGGGGRKLDLKEARTFRIIIKPSTFAHWIATSKYALDKWVKWPLSRLFCSLKEMLVDWYWFSWPPLQCWKRWQSPIP